MEVQSECAEPPPAAATPPCDPQPPPAPPPAAGKINRAAFKLFGKRRSGSGMAGFFSFRNKGAAAAASNNNNHANDANGSSGGANNGCSSSSFSSSSAVEIIRSKTHDGLAVTATETSGGAANGGGAVEAASSQPGGGARGGREVGTVRSLGKSLSFFSLLRRGSLRASGGGESGGGGGGTGLVGRRGRGLKGLFSSMRWRRKDKSVGGDGETAAVEGREACRDGNHGRREEAEKDITLTLEPPPQPPHQALGEKDHGSTPEGRSLPGRPETCRHAANVAATASPPPPPPHGIAVDELPPCGELDSSSVFPYTPTDSPLHGGAAAPPPPLLLLSSKANKTTSSVSSYSPPPSATPPLDPPLSEPSADRLCSSLLLFTDVTSLKSFDSLTGCGDIIADADEEAGGGGGVVGGNGGGSGSSSSSSGGGVGGTGVAAGERPTTTGAGGASRGSSPCKTAAASSLPARARAAAAATPPPPTPLPQQQQQHQHPQTGSGVVAYMGGGEEMASPEGVDDADMQGLWHMLPSTGDNSPALPPRSHQTPAPSSNPPVGHHHHHHRAAAAPALRGGERNKPPPQVKALGLSKIPVVGGGGGGGGRAAAAKPPLPHGRHAAAVCTSSPPGDKEPLSDEGYWDTPSATPTATPDEGGGVQPRSTRTALMSRDSCSGDHLYDLYNDPEEGDDEALGRGEEDDLACSTPSPSAEHKLSPPSATTPPSSASSSSSFRSLKGSASLPRPDSKIPISVGGGGSKPCTPPHSVSQSALSSVVEASAVVAVDGPPPPPPPKTTEASAPARTRIPVSKVPVRRSAGGNASRGHRK